MRPGEGWLLILVAAAITAGLGLAIWRTARGVGLGNAGLPMARAFDRQMEAAEARTWERVRHHQEQLARFRTPGLVAAEMAARAEVRDRDGPVMWVARRLFPGFLWGLLLGVVVEGIVLLISTRFTGHIRQIGL